MSARLLDARSSFRDDGVVCCTVGNEQYALGGADVRQIVRVEQMRCGAGGDGRVGTFEMGSQSVPVFSLASALGRAATHGPQSSGQHVAITGEAGELTGWLADRIVRVTMAEGADVAPLPSVIGPPATMWFDGLLKLDDRFVLLLAPRRLNPLTRTSARWEGPAASLMPGTASEYGAPHMVVLFSTPALPPCAATRYALTGRQTVAIVQPGQTISVPGSARHVKGVAWWRNAAVAVVDFRGPGAYDDVQQRRRWIVAQCGARLRRSLVAFPVDSEITVHRPSTEDQPVAGVLRPPFAVGVFDVGGEVVALVDVDALLASEMKDAQRVSA